MNNLSIERLREAATLPGLSTQAGLCVHPNYRARIALAKSPHLHPEIEEKLACDKAPSVRASLAKNPNLSLQTFQTLAKDKSRKTFTALMSNPRLPSELKDSLLEQQNNNAQRVAFSNIGVVEKIETTVEAVAGVREVLDLLRSNEIKPDVLRSLLTHPAKIVRFAVAAYPSADETLFESLVSSSAIDWALAPIARRTRNTSLIDEFTQTSDLQVLAELVQNPAVPKTSLIRIAAKFRNIRLLTLMADAYFDEAEVIDAIIKHRSGRSKWELAFEKALDPATPTSALMEIHQQRRYRYRCFSRALARHAQCPEEPLAHFAFHLPDDAITNAKVSDAEKERRAAAAEPCPAPYKAFPGGDDAWYYFDAEQLPFGDPHHAEDVYRPQATRYYSYEFAVDAMIDSSDSKVRREAALCTSLSPLQYYRLLLLNDHVVERRIAESSVKPLPTFVLEYLVRSLRSSVTNQLARRSDLSETMRQQLRLR